MVSNHRIARLANRIVRLAEISDPSAELVLHQAMAALHLANIRFHSVVALMPPEEPDMKTVEDLQKQVKTLTLKAESQVVKILPSSYRTTRVALVNKLIMALR